MPDTQTVDTAPAPAAAPSTPPETTQPVAAVTQTTATNGSAPAAQATQAAPVAPTEKTEWDGNLESLKDLPKDQVEHAKSVRRYLTREREKDAQRTADIRAKADQLEKIQSDPQFAQFQQWKQGQQFQVPQQAAAAQPQMPWTENEWNEAQLNPAKMAELFQRGIQHGVQQQISQYAPIVQGLQQKQAFLESAQTVQDFGELHPDMWDLYEAGIMKPIVQSLVDSGKGSIADAYAEAKKIEAHYRNQAQQFAQGQVLAKKNAVTAAPSSAGEPSVIWANDKQEWERITYDNAVLGKVVQVRIKPRS